MIWGPLVYKVSMAEFQWHESIYSRCVFFHCNSVHCPWLFHIVFVNGKFCKDPKLARAEDFFFSGLLTPQNTSNPVGSFVTPANVMQIPGLNTLGISMARIDFAPYGLNPPHTHPRATEILVVLEGSLYVGFVTSNNQDMKNRLFTKVLYIKFLSSTCYI